MQLNQLNLSNLNSSTITNAIKAFKCLPETSTEEKDFQLIALGSLFTTLSNITESYLNVKDEIELTSSALYSAICVNNKNGITLNYYPLRWSEFKNDIDSYSDDSHCIYVKSAQLSINYSNVNENPKTAPLQIKSIVKSITIECKDFKLQGDIKYMLQLCSGLIEIYFDDLYDSTIANMDYMFLNCLNVKNIILSNFTGESLLSMQYTFQGCSSLVELALPTITGTNLQTINGMFYNCSSLTKVDLSNLNGNNVSSMNELFENCSSLTEIHLEHFTGMKLISATNAFKLNNSVSHLLKIYALGSLLNKLSILPDSRLINKDEFIFNNSELYELPARSTTDGVELCIPIKWSEFKLILDSVNNITFTWNTFRALTIKDDDPLESPQNNPLQLNEIFKSLTIICDQLIFPKNSFYVFSNGNKYLNTIELLRFTGNDIAFSFYHYGKHLKTITMTDYIANNINSVESLFNGCLDLEEVDLPKFTGNDVSNINNMFLNSNNIESIKLPLFTGNNITTCISAFALRTNTNTYSYLELTALGSFITKCCTLNNSCLYNPQSMVFEPSKLYSVFCKCSDMRTDIITPTLWNNFKTDLDSCTSATYTSSSSDIINTLDLNNNPTTNPLQLSSSLKNIIFSNQIDFLQNTNNLFYNQIHLKTINMSNYIGADNRDISNMFANCSSLTSVNLSSFVGSKVSNADNLFLNCSSLTTIDLSSFKVDSLVSATNAFQILPTDYVGERSITIKAYGKLFKKFNELDSKLTIPPTVNIDDETIYAQECIADKFGVGFIGDIKYSEFKAILDVETSEDVKLYNMNIIIKEDSDDDPYRNPLNIQPQVRKISLIRTFITGSINSMFANFTNLTEINIPNWSGSANNNNKYIYGMFSGCSNLISIDLHSFAGGGTEDIIDMFSGCSSLSDVNLENFTGLNLHYFRGVFNNCQSLNPIVLPKLNPSNLTDSESTFTTNNSSGKLNIFCYGSFMNQCFNTGGAMNEMQHFPLGGYSKFVCELRNSTAVVIGEFPQ